MSLDGVLKLALIPLAAGQDFGLVALQERVQLFGGRGHVAGNFVRVEKEHALVDIGWHRGSLACVGWAESSRPTVVEWWASKTRPTLRWHSLYFSAAPALKRFMHASIP